MALYHIYYIQVSVVVFFWQFCSDGELQKGNHKCRKIKCFMCLNPENTISIPDFAIQNEYFIGLYSASFSTKASTLQDYGCLHSTPHKARKHYQTSVGLWRVNCYFCFPNKCTAHKNLMFSTLLCSQGSHRSCYALIGPHPSGHY